MTITVRGHTLGAHTHFTIWVNRGQVTGTDDVCLRNDDVPEFLARLRPDEIHDETCAPHRRVLTECSA